MKLKIGTYKKGAVYSSAFSIGSKLTAFVMQLLIAYYLGANTGTDIYFYLFNIAILVGGLVQTLNTSILIPKAMFLRYNESSRAEMQFHQFISLHILITGSRCITSILHNWRQTSTRMDYEFPHPRYTQSHLSILLIFPTDSPYHSKSLCK